MFHCQFNHSQCEMKYGNEIKNFIKKKLSYGFIFKLNYTLLYHNFGNHSIIIFFSIIYVYTCSVIRLYTASF